jgi:exodeoxyribonuclease VII small subunit
MPDEKSIDDLTYEEAFSELESLVTELEGNARPLEESLALYERGQALARRCAQLLERAELRLKQLAGDSEVDFEGPE